MRFRVGREVLGEAVAWVARALSSRPVVPVLTGLLLQADDDGLTLSCFDYEISARVRIEADVKEPGTVLVPGRLLADITRSLPALDVEVATDADLVGLTCGSAEFGLVSLPVEEYPVLPDLPPIAGTVDGGVLAVAAAQVVPSASKDDTLPMLTAVCLDIDGETMTLAATDRYRMAVRDVRWDPANPGLRAAAMVPAKTLADVARTMAAGVPVTVAFGTSDVQVGTQGAGESSRDPRPADGVISFEGGDRRLTARLIGGEFIKYQSRFPAEFGSHALLPAGPFTEAVRRVSLVAERATPVRLAFDSGKVVIEAHTDGRARASETVPAEFEGDEQVISFSPHYLLDGLAAATAAAADPVFAPREHDDEDARPADPGQIRLEFTTPAKPALITWAGDDGPDPAHPAPAFRYLVVPLRVPARA
ncbi:MAG TPA: DNA polymerase III subunit beta [Streptosporangiaceae bacterium]|nr:DNA polymerase III subunit beta [Streptosporangiaceae bacterium]